MISSADKFSMSNNHQIFVYGTLLGGRLRFPVWPKNSISIQIACTAGLMYDLGPYPAIISGNGWIAGEVHRIGDEDWPETIAALDAFEEYKPHDIATSLYTRQLVDVELADGQVSHAWAYFLQDVTIQNGLGTKYPLVEATTTINARLCQVWNFKPTR